MAVSREFWRAGAAAALSLAMWAANASASKPITERNWKPVQFETLERGFYGFCTNAAVLSAKQDCEWNTGMDELEAKGELLVVPGPRAPRIDWGRKSALMVALGSIGAGYAVEVTNVWRWGNRLMIDARIQEDPPSLSIAGASPYHLLVVDTKAVDLVQVRYETPDRGFPLLAHRRMRCGLPLETVPLEATEVSRPTWGTVKALYR